MKDLFGIAATPFPNSFKCFTCERARDNYNCNIWAEDKWCPEGNLNLWLKTLAMIPGFLGLESFIVTKLRDYTGFSPTLNVLPILFVFTRHPVLYVSPPLPLHSWKNQVCDEEMCRPGGVSPVRLQAPQGDRAHGGSTITSHNIFFFLFLTGNVTAGSTKQKVNEN